MAIGIGSGGGGVLALQYCILIFIFKSLCDVCSELIPDFWSNCCQTLGG